MLFHAVSQLLDGLAYVLVFLSMLEFIVAQSPLIMQGFLIGLWYAMQALGIIINVIFLTTYAIGGCQYWSDVAKTVLAGISLVTFVVAARRYTYRQRDELTNVNQQNIIEEYTERQLRCAEKHAIQLESL